MGFGGFSWKRASGLTRVKTNISRTIGIPLTKGGRQRKLGAAIGGNILGAVAPSRNRRTSSSTAYRISDGESHSGPEAPGGTNYPGLYRSAHGCLVFFIVCAISAIPRVGLFLALAFLIVYYVRARGERNESIRAMAKRVTAFRNEMDFAPLPEFKRLTRGSPEKIMLYESLRGNHVRVAAALAQCTGSEEALRYASHLAACGTMKELEEPEGRIVMLAEMASANGKPEALYCIRGYYADDDQTVKKIHDTASTMTGNPLELAREIPT